jgi:hypothetical protein
MRPFEFDAERYREASTHQQEWGQRIIAELGLAGGPTHHSLPSFRQERDALGRQALVQRKPPGVKWPLISRPRFSS